MKTSLTLNAVLFALTLTPAMYATGAQDQTQEASTPAIATVIDVARAPATRSFLERLEIDVRESLIGSLRDSALRVLQLAAPALREAVSIDTGAALEASTR